MERQHSAIQPEEKWSLGTTFLHDLDVRLSPPNSYLCCLDVSFIPPIPTELPYKASNDEYTDEYWCRDFSPSLLARCYYSRYQNRVHWRSLTNHLTLFWQNIPLFLVSTLCPCVTNSHDSPQASQQLLLVAHITSRKNIIVIF